MLEDFINKIKNPVNLFMNLEFFEDKDSNGSYIIEYGNYIDGFNDVNLQDVSELYKPNKPLKH